MEFYKSLTERVIMVAVLMNILFRDELQLFGTLSLKEGWVLINRDAALEKEQKIRAWSSQCDK
jgi:hypothetical protein